jgi:hypothetical protein
VVQSQGNQLGSILRAGVLTALLLACASVSAWAQLETRATTQLLSAPGNAAVALGDFNHDGKLDVAAVAEELQIFLGNGDGTFQAPINYAVGDNPYSVAVADFNGDGNLDLAVANFLSSTVSILFGNGDGTFQSQATLNTSTFPLYIAVGDFNGDHKPDLVVLGDDSIDIFLNNGDGTFKGPISTPQGGSALGVGDFDHDGRLDLAVSQSADTNSWVAIFFGNSDGTFTEGASYPIPTQPMSVAVADFRGDGRLDLAIPTFIGGAVSVLLGNGDGTFQSAVNYPSNVADWVATGDFNGDGKQDLVVSNFSDNGYPTGSVSIFLGNGDGTFKPESVFPAGFISGSVAVGDFNGDRKLDVIDVDSSDDYFLTMMNTGTADFSPTSPVTFPTQLIGTTSAPLGATLTNGGTTAMTVSSVMCCGGPFKMKKTTCEGSLAPGEHCTVTADFTARVEGPVSGAVTFKDSASSKPQVVELVGTGTVVELSPLRLKFPPQKVGTKSAPQTIQLTNTGSIVLDFTHFIFINGNNYNDFSESDNCGSEIGPGASCVIKIAFSPHKTGPRSAFVQIEDDGGGSPQEPILSGTGE